MGSGVLAALDGHRQQPRPILAKGEQGDRRIGEARPGEQFVHRSRRRQLAQLGVVQQVQAAAGGGLQQAVVGAHHPAELLFAQRKVGRQRIDAADQQRIRPGHPPVGERFVVTEAVGDLRQAQGAEHRAEAIQAVALPPLGNQVAGALENIVDQQADPRQQGDHPRLQLREAQQQAAGRGRIVLRLLQQRLVDLARRLQVTAEPGGDPLELRGGRRRQRGDEIDDQLDDHPSGLQQPVDIRQLAQRHRAGHRHAFDIGEVLGPDIYQFLAGQYRTPRQLSGQVVILRQTRRNQVVQQTSRGIDRSLLFRPEVFQG